MSFTAILYAYVLGGITFIPLVIAALVWYTLYTSVPVGDLDPSKVRRGVLERSSQEESKEDDEDIPLVAANPTPDVNDVPKPRKGWLTVRRTFEESATDGSYVGLVRGFLDARSKDPKRSRPKDMWYVVLKGKVLYLYEDEAMTECEAAIELGGHDVIIYPEGLLDGELFAKRNAICLRPKVPTQEKEMPSVTKEMRYDDDLEEKLEKMEDRSTSPRQRQKNRERLLEAERRREEEREEALDPSTPWFIFVRSNVEMEDWYFSLIHASDQPAHTSTLLPLQSVFQPTDMSHLVATLDEQPDVIPMRWLNALLGRLFFSYYRTHALESYIIGRLMKKLSKIKRPGFLTHIVVREVSVGNKAPTLSKPMLKELTKEGDASLEVHLHYKGEIRITIEAIATINLGARFKSYAVKLVLAAVLREIEGNLLVKVKRPPSNRIWYAFTQMPRMVLDVEPVVSDRQITWGMILGTIESRLKEVIQESVVMPNMDDIAFFESAPYARRGGIWADASRHENLTSLFPEPVPPAEDDKSTASDTVPDTTLLAPPQDATAVQRSQSVDVTASEGADFSVPPEGVQLPRAATTTGASPPESSSASTKRRTWFGSVRSISGDPFADQPSEDESSDRGRSSEGESSRTRGSSSSRSSGSGSRGQGLAGDLNDLLTPVPIRTSSRRSYSSSSYDAVVPTHDSSSTSTPSESHMASFRNEVSTPPPPQKNQPSSPTFFQTLKTRDKQAISNSAKEAMRKWGMNWGTLRKDSTTSSSNTDELVNGDEPRQDPKLSHKPRTSYADVRAAVVQRKEREKSPTPETLVADLLPPNWEIGRQAREKASGSGAPSGRSSEQASSYSGGVVLTPSASPQPDDGSSKSKPPSRSASPFPATRTSSHHSNPPIEALLGPAGGLQDEDEPPVVPIHTQPPQPKMMIIPGIHASHRGEVMSMGYAPPPPTLPETKKGAAIQSVYRLWKTPSISGHPMQPNILNGFTGQDQDATPAAASSSSTTIQGDPPPLPSRPVPPPLPPRSNSTHAVSTKAETPREFEGERTSSAAASALQSIVTKDRSKRASLEALGSGTPPSPSRPEDTADTRSGQGDRSIDTPTPPLNVSPDVTSTSTVDAGRIVNAKPPLPPRRIQTPA